MSQYQHDVPSSCNTTVYLSQDTDAINSDDYSYHDLISTEMLEYICDGSQTHPNVNRREARYKIRDRIRQKQLDWKGASKAT